MCNNNNVIKKGRIIPNGVVVEKHEYVTILALTEVGYDVEVIPPSNTHGAKNPDVLIEGLKLEMKSPIGKGK